MAARALDPLPLPAGAEAPPRPLPHGHRAASLEKRHRRRVASAPHLGTNITDVIRRGCL